MKDAYVMMKQMKFFALIMLVLAVIPSSFTRGFAIMYASMMPITALAFDEQAKWDYYAEMMPYKKRDLTLSKYTVGILFLLMVCVIEALAIIVTGVIQNQSIELIQSYLTTIVVIASAATILMALNLPIIFKMGAERGRMVYIVLMVLAAIVVTNFAEMKNVFWNLNESTILLLFVAAAVAALLISMAISVKVYNSKRY